MKSTEIEDHTIALSSFRNISQAPNLFYSMSLNQSHPFQGVLKGVMMAKAYRMGKKGALSMVRC